MSYPLRLPPQLDAEVRERCDRLGISVNAFIAVALDAYLRGQVGGGAGRPVKSAQGKAKPGKRARAEPQPVQGVEDGDEGGDDDPNWRFFYRPDGWPLFDPEWQHRWEAIGENDRAAAAALYDEYWRSHEWPDGGKPPTGAEWMADGTH